MKTAVRFVGRFFALALLQVFFGCQDGQCQQAANLAFTNKFATFTNLQGETFIHAELIEADATQVVFKTNNIFGAVKFTNLSTATLESLGIPLSRLDLAKELQVQKAKAIADRQVIFQDEQEKLLDSRNLTKLNIDSVIFKDNDPLYGQVYWCAVRQNNGPVTKLFVARLPDAIRTFFDRRATVAQDIATISDHIDSENARIAAATADLNQAQNQVNPEITFMPVGADSGANTVNVTPESINEAKDQVLAWHKQLDDAQAELDKLNHDAPSATAVFVLRSRFLHNLFPVIICAQPKVEPSGDTQ
jgi:hypothetical protein